MECDFVGLKRWKSLKGKIEIFDYIFFTLICTKRFNNNKKTNNLEK